MDDMTNRNFSQDFHPRQAAHCDPPAWISTEQLDCELWNAIMEDASGICDGDFGEIDTCIDGEYEAEEEESEQRRATLQLLTQMRPRLAELLGGPPAE